MVSDYQFYQRLGICPHCKKQPLYGEEKLCLECKAYFANRMTKQRALNNDRLNQIKNECYKRTAEYRNLNNLCTKCGKPRTDNYKMCPNCRAKNTNYYREKRNLKENTTEKRKRQGLCKFCDNKKMDGYNVCEVHHRKMVELSRSEKQVKKRRSLTDRKILF